MEGVLFATKGYRRTPHEPKENTFSFVRHLLTKRTTNYYFSTHTYPTNLKYSDTNP